MDAKTLALYLGCDVLVTPYEGASFKCKFTGITTKSIAPIEDQIRIQVIEETEDAGHVETKIKWYNEDEITLLLIPLSKMTEGEGIEIFGSEWYSDSPNAADIILNHDSEIQELRLTPNEMKRALSKGFDLFSLIEKGEAFDSTIKI